MVSRVTVRDNLGSVGRAAGEYVTEYTYHDPVFDGLQREFRGFRSTEVTTIGDTNSPTSVTASWFDLGERPKTFPLDDPTVDYTTPDNRWRDNPREALKGLPVRSETYAVGASGTPTTYLSSTATSYRLRKLYDGLDGRAVFVAFADQTDTLLYDTAAFTADSAPVSVPGVSIEAVGSADVHQQPATLTNRAPSASKHLRTRSVVDIWGNRTDAIDEGVVGVDDTIVSHTEPALVPTPSQWGGEGNWSWRTVEGWVQKGTDDSTRRKQTRTQYDGFGDPIYTEALLAGTAELVRPATGAPRPASQSTPGWKWTGATEYDAFGNVTFRAGPDSKCDEVDYDDAFAQLADKETVFAGAPLASKTIAGATYSCGATPLTSVALYDRGLGVTLRVRDLNGETSAFDYDGFGRMTASYRPKLDDPATPSATASLRVEYHLPDETLRPVSMLVSHTEDGDTIGDGQYHDVYAYIDGLGRKIVSLSEADTQVDGFGWVVDGLTDYDAKGAQRRKYLAWEYAGDPSQYDLSAPSPARYGQQRYDAFGRAIATFGLDGTMTLQTRYHALSADAWDAEDIGPGAHAGTYASEYKDGHGRVTRRTERVRDTGGIEEHFLDTIYETTGEPLSITRRFGAQSVPREMHYDSLGRMVANVTPDTGTWRYAYDDSGELVGTSDARGCGENYDYDAAGRLLSEDYSPCADYHAAYSAEPEVVYRYDSPDPDALQAFPGQGQPFSLGRLVSVTDRASKSLTRFDGRGRAVGVAKRLRSPYGAWAPRWYGRTAQYDAADRPVRESTGASVDLPQGASSEVITHYSHRGTVDRVDSSYGLLVDHVRREADGLVTEIGYGDAASTTTGFTYDDLRRLRNLTTYRAHPQSWPQVDTGTEQLLLQDEQYSYDRVGNPTEIRDWRTASEWADGFKPVTRKMQYDDLYRLSRIDYEYPAGSDAWVDPYDAEVSDNTRPQPSPRVQMSGRPLWQTYAYDWVGNTLGTDDDAHAFYDRSLGTVTNDGYRLSGADNASKGGSRTGHLDAQYDHAGNLVSMDLSRAGPCIPAGKCTDQHFEYEWDEVGRLMRARRFDMANPPSGTPPDAELSYRYDASDNRVLKTVGDHYTAYVFGSLELRGAQFIGDDQEDQLDYELDATTETTYLQAHGVRLARVVPRVVNDQWTTRVYLELGDALGSTEVVLDRASGELVERSTAYAYGAGESDYRPERWKSFREDYRFTGKEEDIEVGLQYFGKRYYAPLLQRWISPDPLAVHAPGKADLNLYAYVHGRVLVAVDPVGLQQAGPESRANQQIEQNKARGGDPPEQVQQLNESVVETGLKALGGLVCDALGCGPANTPTSSSDPTGKRVSEGEAAVRVAADVSVAKYLGKVFDRISTILNPGAVPRLTTPTAAPVEAASPAAKPPAPKVETAAPGPVKVTTDVTEAVSESLHPSASAAGGGVRYGAHEIGPLAADVASTFRGGSYTARVLEEPLRLYRTYGGSAGPLGRYWTATPVRGPLQAQMDLALAPQWGNTAQSVATIRAPAGTAIYEGFAAPQSTGVGQVLGGGSQIYIPRIDPSWLVGR